MKSTGKPLLAASGRAFVKCLRQGQKKTTMNKSPASDRLGSDSALLGLKGTYSALKEGLHENGADLAKIAYEWSLGIKKALEPEGADRDFEVLCDQGCHPWSLAVSVFAAEFYPILVLSVRAAFVRSKQRVGYSRKLRQAADILGQTVFTDKMKDGLWLKLKARHESLPEPPSAMIRDLEFYARLFEFAELVSRNAGIKSDRDLPRFIVTSYVHPATGRWHDKEVSALVQGDGTEIYDETAHRVWRNRNFSRLNRHYRTLSELLQEVGELVGATE
jgi:hypothetical protein